MKLWFDTETFSELDLKTVGTANYAAACEIMLNAWAVDDGPVRVDDQTDGRGFSNDFLRAFTEADEVWAHNAWFDRSVLAAHDLTTPADRWRCTMAKALAHSLPGSLDTLGDVFSLKEDERKRKEGHALVMLFCKPRPKNMTLRRATKETHPEEWARFVDYARQDVESMRILAGKIPNWNYTGRELALWHLDQQINERGFLVDRALADAALAAVKAEQSRLADQSYILTAGEVAKATQRDQLLRYVLEAHGVDLPDMAASTLERRIDDPDAPDAVKELLRVRLQASTSSTSKYTRAISGASADGRLRGGLQFCGASRTGRWAGRMFQPHNLPRPSLKKPVIDAGIDAMLAGCVDLVIDNVMELASNALRGLIVSPLGRKLIVSDLSNIEGRGMAWLAGEEWKLEAFRAFDAGTGPDLYKLAYAGTFGTTVDLVVDWMRQIGKVLELSMQYQGGAGAFVTMAAGYGIDLLELTERAHPMLPDWARREAESYLDFLHKQAAETVENKLKVRPDLLDQREEMIAAECAKQRYGLPEKVFVTCDALKRGWRARHPNIVQFWADLENAFKEAIRCEPGPVWEVGKLKVDRWRAWVRVQLPSGRYLCYPSARIERSGKISYMGVNPKSRKWTRIYTYGGKLSENANQGLARDVMAENMPIVEAAGYEITLTVHDELITEAPDDDRFGSETLSKLLAANPPWAPDLPLAAGGHEMYRYAKL